MTIFIKRMSIINFLCITVEKILIYDPKESVSSKPLCMC